MATVAGCDAAAVMLLTRRLDFATKRQILLDLLRHRPVPLDQFDRIRGYLVIPDNLTPLRDNITHSAWKPGATATGVQPNWILRIPPSVKPARGAPATAGAYVEDDEDRIEYTLDDLVLVVEKSRGKLRVVPGLPQAGRSRPGAGLTGGPSGAIRQSGVRSDLYRLSQLAKRPRALRRRRGKRASDRAVASRTAASRSMKRGRIDPRTSGRGLRDGVSALQASGRVPLEGAAIRPAGQGGQGDRSSRIRGAFHRTHGRGDVRARSRGARHRLERGVRALDRAPGLEGARHQGSLEGFLSRRAPVPLRSRARRRRSEDRHALRRATSSPTGRQGGRTAAGRELVRFAARRARLSRDRRRPDSRR